MTIKASVEDMRKEIVNTTSMIYQMAVVEAVADLMVRVQSVDPITFEYAVTDGNETFTCRNQSLFCNVLEMALS
jgi:hypothetical protein